MDDKGVSQSVSMVEFFNDLEEKGGGSKRKK